MHARALVVALASAAAAETFSAATHRFFASWVSPNGETIAGLPPANMTKVLQKYQRRAGYGFDDTGAPLPHVTRWVETHSHPAQGAAAIAARSEGAANDDGGEHPLFPVYFKLHKTGSGTTARTIRCLAIVHPELVPPDTWRADNYSNRNAATRRKHGAPREPRCGPTAWEHEVLLEYKLGGMEEIGRCVERGRHFRTATLMRDPLERVLSSIYFFVADFKPPRNATKATQLGPTTRDDWFPPALTADVVERIARGDEIRGSGSFTEYLQIFSRWQPEEEVNEMARAASEGDVKTRGGRLRESFADALARYTGRNRSVSPTMRRRWAAYGGWVAWPRAAVEQAKANLARDIDVVGVTESMERFLVLLTLELRWPLAALCQNSARFHANTKRPKRDELPPATLAVLRERLQPELELYEHAKALAAQREARWGSKFEATLAEFRALSANGTCARLVQERWAMTKSLPFDVLSRSQQENCNPWSSGPAVAHRTGDLKGEGSNATKASKLAVSNARAARKEKQQRKRDRERSGAAARGGGSVDDLSEGAPQSQDSSRERLGIDHAPRKRRPRTEARGEIDRERGRRAR